MPVQSGLVLVGNSCRILALSDTLLAMLASFHGNTTNPSCLTAACKNLGGGSTFVCMFRIFFFKIKFLFKCDSCTTT